MFYTSHGIHDCDARRIGDGLHFVGCRRSAVRGLPLYFFRHTHKLRYRLNLGNASFVFEVNVVNLASNTVRL